MLLLPLSASGGTDDGGQPLLENSAGCEDTGRHFQNRSHRKRPEMTCRGAGAWWGGAEEPVEGGW